MYRRTVYVFAYLLDIVVHVVIRNKCMSKLKHMILIGSWGSLPTESETEETPDPTYTLKKELVEFAYNSALKAS